MCDGRDTTYIIADNERQVHLLGNIRPTQVLLRLDACYVSVLKQYKGNQRDIKIRIP